MPEIPEQRPRRLNPAATAIWVLLACAVVLDARVACRGERDVVSADAMRRARDEILSRRQPGDILIHSPLLSVSELSNLGDIVMSSALPTPDVRKTRRVLLLDLVRRPILGLGRANEVTNLDGELTLRTYFPDSTQPLVRFDLVSDIDRASLSVERKGLGTVTRCTSVRTEGGRGCPNEPDWLYLARRELMIGGKVSACIWAHPTTDGELIIEMPPLSEPPLGYGLTLAVSAGLTDDAVRTTPDGASVTTRVVQDGTERGQVVVPNIVGWVESRVAVEPHRAVELRVTTPRDGRRHHCIRATVEEAKR